ncbi:MAG: DUF2214 family protein [Ottowia sp.]|nr:DUF2214 family protein [Ottowia sp.]
MFELEPWLAFFHISAFVGWVVFVSAQTALCRSEWLNEAALRRVLRLDRLLWVAVVLVLVSGLLRVYLGKFGAAFYWANWLLHLKLTLFAIVLVLQALVTRRLSRWRAALPALPQPAQVRVARVLMMASTHLMALLPLAGAFMARGFGAIG